MKYFAFKGSKEELREILKDNAVGKKIKTKLLCDTHLIIGLDIDSQTESYIVIKYGDYMTNISKDRSPVIFKEYTPKDYKKIK